MRLHILDIDDLAVFIEEGHRKRNQRIFHPHANLGRAAEQKNHAVVLRHLLAKHQPLFALVGRGGNFSLYHIHSGSQRGGWEFLLRFRQNGRMGAHCGADGKSESGEVEGTF